MGDQSDIIDRAVAVKETHATTLDEEYIHQQQPQYRMTFDI